MSFSLSSYTRTSGSGVASTTTTSGSSTFFTTFSFLGLLSVLTSLGFDYSTGLSSTFFGLGLASVAFVAAFLTVTDFVGVTTAVKV